MNSEDIIFAGIDIGSVTTKALLLNGRHEILAFSMLPTSYDRHRSGADALRLAMNKTGRPAQPVKYIVSTGYGRRAFNSSDKVLPEIICHARGTRFLFPAVRTIMDIGGQDSKVIDLDEDGNIIKFEMNDKCAAGTGRFLEVLTERILDLPLDELGPLSLNCKNPCTLSSICTVFAESEIISYLSENRSKEDIICGMNKAIAKRVINMGTAGLIAYHEPVVFSGGVARNIGVVKAIGEELGKKVSTPEEPQITAALGAALFAAASSE
jgi:predicted CoA-substrate-specific enzyme activase